MRALFAVVVAVSVQALADDGGVTCKTLKDCGVAPSNDACVASTYGSGPVYVSGPVCLCRAGQCVLEQLEAVPCNTYQDCSLTRDPVLHPVSSKKVPREHKKPVKPCADGERDSVCDPGTHTCKVVSWKC